MSDCVLSITYAEQQELRRLADKTGRLATLIHAGFPKADSGGYSPAFGEYGAGFVILDDETAVTILAPRTLEIAFGQPMPKFKRTAVRRYRRLRERVRSLFPQTTPTDSHTFAVEFEGTTFNVEIIEHEDDDICSTFEEVFNGYGVDDWYSINELLEVGATGWLYVALAPPFKPWHWTTPEFYERPDVGMTF
jgi:hypothetical protein